MLLESKALNYSIQSFLTQTPSEEGRKSFSRIMATYFEQDAELIELLDHLALVPLTDEEKEATADFVCDYKKPLQQFQNKTVSSAALPSSAIASPPSPGNFSAASAVALLEKQVNAISLQGLPDDLTRALAKSRESFASFIQSDQQRQQVIKQASNRSTKRQSSNPSIIDLLRQKQSGVFKQLQQLLEDEERHSSNDPQTLIGPDQQIVCLLFLFLLLC